MSVSAVLTIKAAVAETLTTTEPAVNPSAAQSLNYLLELATTLTAGSGVPATMVYKNRLALSGGALTVDLTALTDVEKGAMSLSGLKVQFVLIKALSTNANDLSYTFGGSSPYNLKGSDFKSTLKAGQVEAFFGNEAAPDVGSGAKNIAFAGTGAQGVDILIVGG